jgi:hypothetical protein
MAALRYTLLVLSLSLSACRDRPAAAPAAAVAQPAAPTEASTEANVLTDPHRFDCASDSDCVNSCRYGAVHAGWYARATKAPGFQECEDGCNNQISAPPRCESGGCVAYQRDPRAAHKITPCSFCTRVER